jgi:hypothetical protein
MRRIVAIHVSLFVSLRDPPRKIMRLICLVANGCLDDRSVT